MPNFNVPVEQYMTEPVHAIAPSDSLASAHQRLEKFAISSLAVTDDGGNLAGVISRSDLLAVGRYQASSRGTAQLLTLPQQSVAELMTSDVLAVGPEDTVERACELMRKRQVHRVFVCDDRGLRGVFSTRDVMQVIAEARLNHPIREFMSKPLFTVRASESIGLATDRLQKARITGLIVVEDEWPVGLFTQAEAIVSRSLPRDTPVEEAMNSAMVCMPSDTRMFRAAQQANAMRVRRIIACRKRDMVGILTGMDFVRAAS